MTNTTDKASPLILREHQRTDADLDLETARALANLPDMEIAVAPGPNGWVVRPSSIVGATQANGRQVLIRPKIGMANLLNLLEVSPSSLVWNKEAFGYDSEPNVIVALIRMLRRGLDQALSQGLRHDYVERVERTAAVRGRINFPSLVGRPGLPSPIPCRFDEYTADIELNRLLLAATEAALHTPGVPDDDRLQLRKHRNRFEDIPPIAQPPHWVDTWEPNRLETHYELAVRAAAMLLRNRSPVDRLGTNGLHRFTVNMNYLVEQFITRRISQGLPPELEMRAQANTSLDTGRQITVRPDLVIYRNNSPCFVIDIKYKALESISDTSTSDLFQLHTYAQLLGLQQGAIISCLAGDQTQRPPQHITVRQSDVNLHLWPLDLRGTPESIDTEITRLIGMIRAHVDTPVH